MLRPVEKTLGLLTPSIWGKSPQRTANLHDAQRWHSSYCKEILQEILIFYFIFIYRYCSSSYLGLLNQHDELLWVDGLLSLLGTQTFVYCSGICQEVPSLQELPQHRRKRTSRVTKQPCFTFLNNDQHESSGKF